MVLTNFFLLFVSILGFFLVSFLLLKRALTLNLLNVKIFEVNYISTLLFILGISWFLSLGLRALIATSFYYLSIPASFCLLFTGLFGFVFTVFYLNSFLKSLAKFNFTANFNFSLIESILLSIIALLFLLYFYKSGVPWFDNDEIVVNGYFTKLIANNFVFLDMEVATPELSPKLDMINHGLLAYAHRPKFIEAMEAQLYLPFLDTLFVRLNRVFSLLFLSVIVFSFLKIINIKRIWILFALLLFISIYEMGYIITSLKPDGMVMMFEVCSLLLLAFGLYVYFINKNDLPQTIKLIFLALIFSLFSIGSRHSGLYITLLSFLLFSFFIIIEFLAFKKSRKFILRKNIVLILIASVVGLLSCLSYFLNIKIFGNPIFPVQSPWPFQNGLYLENDSLEMWTVGRHTIPLPPILQHFFLILSLSFGTEILILKNLIPSSFPHTQSLNSISLISPIILSIFLVPFFFKNRKILTILFCLFLFQFILWSAGLNLSRMFLSSCVVSIILTTIVCNIDKSELSNLKRFVQDLIKVGVVFCIVFTSILHLRHALNYPHNVGAFFNDSERFNSNNNLLNKYHNQDTLMSFDQRNVINRYLVDSDKAKVVVLADAGRILHILFEKGLFVGFDNQTLLDETYNGQLRVNYSNCILAEKKFFRLLDSNFTSEVGPETKEIRLKTSKGTVKEFSSISEDLNWGFYCST